MAIYLPAPCTHPPHLDGHVGALALAARDTAHQALRADDRVRALSEAQALKHALGADYTLALRGVREELKDLDKSR